MYHLYKISQHNSSHSISLTFDHNTESTSYHTRWVMASGFYISTVGGINCTFLHTVYILREELASNLALLTFATLVPHPTIYTRKSRVPWDVKRYLLKKSNDPHRSLSSPQCSTPQPPQLEDRRISDAPQKCGSQNPYLGVWRAFSRARMPTIPRLGNVRRQSVPCACC